MQADSLSVAAGAVADAFHTRSDYVPHSPPQADDRTYVMRSPSLYTIEPGARTAIKPRWLKLI
jgi:hypothetical protein